MQRSNPDVAKFYNSPQWKKVRASYKLYRHNICERCGGVGYFVHHKNYITSKNVFNPDITLAFDNLELLCKNCHNKEHFEQSDFTNDGQLKEEKKSAFELLKCF